MGRVVGWSPADRAAEVVVKSDGELGLAKRTAAVHGELDCDRFAAKELIGRLPGMVQ